MKKNYEIPNVSVHRFDISDVLTSVLSVPDIDDMVKQDVIVW